jgi:hypothetical protein
LSATLQHSPNRVRPLGHVRTVRGSSVGIWFRLAGDSAVSVIRGLG